jgi:hypothetical protein
MLKLMQEMILKQEMTTRQRKKSSLKLQPRLLLIL